MIAINEDSLVITIRDNEPAQRREQLIKAIAYHMRMEAYASCDVKYTRDGENRYVIAQLLEELTMMDE